MSMVDSILQELIQHQKQKLLQCGKRLVPSLIADDLLQPNDFPILENHPEFRYEEGILHGLQTLEAALKTQ